MYNADKSKEITQPGQEWSDLLSIGSYSDGIRVSAKVSQRQRVRLIPSATQKLYSDKFVVNSDDYLHGNGAVGTDGSFYFNIYAQE